MPLQLMNLLLLIFIHQPISYVLCTDPRIVGGEECPYELYPYAVAMFSGRVCGGCLISLEWVLTAAHCVNSTVISKRKLLLRTGFNQNKFVQKRRAIRGIQHPKYKTEFEKDVRYDIGLVLAAKPFRQTDYLKPAKLPNPGFESKCKTAIAMGIGEEKKLKHGEKPTKKSKQNEPLRCIELPVVGRKKCSRLWKGVVGKSIICLLDEKGEKGSCYGDSGSPIVCKGVVIGVTAGGAGCAQNNTPSLYTSVEYFLDFISENTDIGEAGGRSLIGLNMNGSNTNVPKKCFLIIAFSLRYLMVNGFVH